MLVNGSGWHQHPGHLGHDYQSNDNQEPPVSDFKSNNEFLLVGVLPSLLCYLAGCAFLFLHYKAFHPWRNLFTWQREQEARAVLKEETPCWEEVRKSLFLPIKNFKC